MECGLRLLFSIGDAVDVGSQPLPRPAVKSANGSLTGCAFGGACDDCVLRAADDAAPLEFIGFSGTLAALKVGSRLSNNGLFCAEVVLAALAPIEPADVVLKSAKFKLS